MSSKHTHSSGDSLSRAQWAHPRSRLRGAWRPGVRNARKLACRLGLGFAGVTTRLPILPEINYLRANAPLDWQFAALRSGAVRTALEVRGEYRRRRATREKHAPIRHWRARSSRSRPDRHAVARTVLSRRAASGLEGSRSLDARYLVGVGWAFRAGSGPVPARGSSRASCLGASIQAHVEPRARLEFCLGDVALRWRRSLPR